jgi:hypothetical protein
MKPTLKLICGFWSPLLLSQLHNCGLCPYAFILVFDITDISMTNYSNMYLEDFVGNAL